MQQIIQIINVLFMHHSQTTGILWACSMNELRYISKGGQLMKKNVCYYMMMAASAIGQELTANEQKMLAEFLRN